MTVLWVVIVGVLAGLVALGLIVLVAAGLRHRQQAWRLRAYALRQGWTYQATDPDLAQRWPDLPLMATDGHARDIATGRIDGLDFRTFVYTPGRADHPADVWRHVSGAGVVAVTTPAAVPLVVLEPTSFVDALGWGEDDALTLGQADFDAAWQVYGDETTARAILTDAVVAWLMDPEHRVSYGFDQGELVIWTVERIVPDDVEVYVGHLADLLALIPPEVWAASVEDPATAVDPA